MDNAAEKKLIRQNNEMHAIVCGTGDEPGLCEKQRALERRVGRLEATAKWLTGIFTTIFLAIFGFFWHKK